MSRNRCSNSLAFLSWGKMNSSRVIRLNYYILCWKAWSKVFAYCFDHRSEKVGLEVMDLKKIKNWCFFLRGKRAPEAFRTSLNFSKFTRTQIILGVHPSLLKNFDFVENLIKIFYALNKGLWFWIEKNIELSNILSNEMEHFTEQFFSLPLPVRNKKILVKKQHWLPLFFPLHHFPFIFHRELSKQTRCWKARRSDTRTAWFNLEIPCAISESSESTCVGGEKSWNLIGMKNVGSSWKVRRVWSVEARQKSAWKFEIVAVSKPG